MTRIFVSYRWEDRDHKEGFRGLLMNPNNELFDVPIEEIQRFDTTEEIQRYLNTKIRQASAIVVLIGNNTHNGPWVKHELEVANSQRKPIIPVRIPETNGGLPAIIRNQDLIEWDADDINQALTNIFGR